MSEELIVRYCSPTLAGLKTGNAFSCRYEDEDELRDNIRRMNVRLRTKGLRILPLKKKDGLALIYVYRPARLKNDLSDEEAGRLLEKYGYEITAPERCVAHLINRLRTREDFPHEIGLFLGYPPADVKGFIENDAKCSKCVGCWKVYGDEEQAKRKFAMYKKCTDIYLDQLIRGKTIERLTVAV